jgi:uncharacterized protein YfiM (DUF2279 family)
MKKWVGLLVLSFLLIQLCEAQNDSTAHQIKNAQKLAWIEAGAYTAGITGLSILWYKDQQSSSFHFFNDNDQWLQMDKAGHFYTSYHLGLMNANLFQQAGLKRNQSLWIGSLTGFMLMLPIEILDGFSESYGASWGDALANAAGALAIWQTTLFNDIYLHPKFSVHATNFAAQRPEVLGSNLAERWLKDYNGQTYWLSANLNLLDSKDRFPNWLALAFGYSGTNMLYGQLKENIESGIQPRRQFLLSLDVDFTKIPTDKKWLKKLFYALNFIKVPFPTLEFSNNSIRAHAIYF